MISKTKAQPRGAQAMLVGILSSLTVSAVGFTSSPRRLPAFLAFDRNFAARNNNHITPSRVCVAVASIPSPSSTGTSPSEDAGTDFHSIIDDGKGHISGELAQSIWEWENTHRLHGDDFRDESVPTGTKKNRMAPELKFSTRDGLRLVDEIAREIISSTSASSSSTSSSSASATEDSSATSFADLTQEGVVALMKAMATYDPDHFAETFEQYARRTVHNAMSHALAYSSRPIRLPSHVQDDLRHARQVASKLRASLGREPTLHEVARASGLAPEKLQIYRIVGRGSISVESTVEIYDPSFSAPTFADEDQYESEHPSRDGAFLHSGEDNFVEEEEEWVEPPDKIVAPLRDFIADTTGPTPDDLALQDMIRHDVDEFLVRTLTPRELEVIRMRFGLDDGTSDGLTLIEIGDRLKLSRQRVAQIEQAALEKLRTSYANEFVGTYLDDDHATEVSV